MRRAAALLGFAALSLTLAAAEAGTLEGLPVTFTVLTYDDPALPLLQARGFSVVVGDGVEFSLDPEGLTGGLDVVPVEIDLGPSRVEISYSEFEGQFYEAAFNGYVLRFNGACALFDDVKIDRSFTTMPLKDSDIFTDGQAIYINVANQTYGPEKRIAVDLAVADCPIS